MKKIYLFIPALFLSLGLLAQTPAPEVQKADSLRADTLEIGNRGMVTTVKEETIVGNELDVLSASDTTRERTSFTREEIKLFLDIGLEDKFFSKDPAITVPGNYTWPDWTNPPNFGEIEFIVVDAYGAGGGGSRGYEDIRAGGGGGGGAFDREVLSIADIGDPVVGDPIFYITVGGGGSGQAEDGSSPASDGGHSEVTFANKGEKIVWAEGGHAACQVNQYSGSEYIEKLYNFNLDGIFGTIIGVIADLILGENINVFLGGDAGVTGLYRGGYGPPGRIPFPLISGASGSGGSGAGPLGIGGEGSWTNPIVKYNGNEGSGNPPGWGGSGRQAPATNSNSRNGFPGQSFGGGGGGGAYYRGGIFGWGASNGSGGDGANGAVIIRYELENVVKPCNVISLWDSDQMELEPFEFGEYSVFDICDETSFSIIADAECLQCGYTSYKWIDTSGGNLVVVEEDESLDTETFSNDYSHGYILVEGNYGECYDLKSWAFRKNLGPEIKTNEEGITYSSNGENFVINISLGSSEDESIQINHYLFPIFPSKNYPITRVEWDWDPAYVSWVSEGTVNEGTIWEEGSGNWVDIHGDDAWDISFALTSEYTSSENPIIATITVTDAMGCFSTFYFPPANNPLPIELLSFTATFREPEVVLEWATGSEINNDFFTIERSLDVEQAEIIGYLDGAGNSSQTLWYSFVDQNPLPGISYYRLKQTDFDGKFEYFDWVAVDAGLAEGNGLKVLVETLPLGYNLRIFSPGGRRLQVEVTDLLGRRVINEQLSAPEQGQVEVFIPATASRQSVLIYRVTDGMEVVAGKMVR